MCQLAVAIPDAVLYETKMSRDETLDFIRRTLATEYYKNLGVSLGYCSKIAEFRRGHTRVQSRNW